MFLIAFLASFLIISFLGFSDPFWLLVSDGNLSGDLLGGGHGLLGAVGGPGSPDGLGEPRASDSLKFLAVSDREQSAVSLSMSNISMQSSDETPVYPCNRDL